MPEQEFPPPARLARSYRPDRDDEDPPPWANLPPVRPARPGRPAGAAILLVPAAGGPGDRPAVPAASSGGPGA